MKTFPLTTVTSITRKQLREQWRERFEKAVEELGPGWRKRVREFEPKYDTAWGTSLMSNCLNGTTVNEDLTVLVERIVELQQTQSL